MKYRTALFALAIAVTLPSSLASQTCKSPALPKDIRWSAEGLARVRQVTDSLHSAAFMVVTDGKLVASWGDTTRLYRIHSIRKSLMSALYGIYTNKGVIDTTATLRQLGIDEKVPLSDVELSARVVDLLRARSGVYIEAASEVQSMAEKRPARHSHAPDTFWYYNNWDFNVLGTIFKQVTHDDIFEAFDTLVAKPIGMTEFHPELAVYSTTATSKHRGYAIRMSARDLARFGMLYLNEGCWNGRQILPRSWARASTSVHSRTGDSGTKSGYGFMFWVTSPDASGGIPTPSYTMSGAGGHRVTVFPALNTVVVNRMETDKGGPYLDSPEWDLILRELIKARVR